MKETNNWLKTKDFGQHRKASPPPRTTTFSPPNTTSGADHLSAVFRGSFLRNCSRLRRDSIPITTPDIGEELLPITEEEAHAVVESSSLPNVPVRSVPTPFDFRTDRSPRRRGRAFYNPTVPPPLREYSRSRMPNSSDWPPFCENVSKESFDVGRCRSIAFPTSDQGR